MRLLLVRAQRYRPLTHSHDPQLQTLIIRHTYTLSLLKIVPKRMQLPLRRFATRSSMPHSMFCIKVCATFTYTPQSWKPNASAVDHLTLAAAYSGGSRPYALPCRSHLMYQKVYLGRSHHTTSSQAAGTACKALRWGGKDPNVEIFQVAMPVYTTTIISVQA